MCVCMYIKLCVARCVCMLSLQESTLFVNMCVCDVDMHVLFSNMGGKICVTLSSSVFYIYTHQFTSCV